MLNETSASLESASERSLDLDEVEAQLDAVEVALVRLEDGTYFTDEVTGKPLDDQLLSANPIARRA
ncbi:MAG: hypothetical protein ABI570_00900 [Ilumatobacteraceae bacterium]